MSFDNGPKVVTNGLVLSLDAADRNSYPGSGTTWIDLSGNGYTGTLINGPTYSTNNGGNLLFDGSDDYVTSNTSLPLITNDITLIVFANIISFSNRNFLLSKYQTTTPYGFVFEVGTDSTNWTNTMRFYAQGNDACCSVDYRGSVQLTNNTTYMFTVQFKTSTSIQMFYNLTEMTATHANASWASVTGWTNGTNVYSVGALPPPVGVYSNYRIYNTLVYNRILTFSELTQNYNALKSRFGL